MENFEELLAKADAGDRDSQFFVAKAYQEGDGIAQDYDAAIKYYDLASSQGDSISQLLSANCKNLSVKIKVTFSIKGYRNGRMVQDNKKFIIHCGDSKVIPSYNADEAFTIDKYFLKKVVIRRQKKGEESYFEIEKGKAYEIDESQGAVTYHYSFEIVYSVSSELVRDLRENQWMVDIDHYELEREICYLCRQDKPELSPYDDDIANVYWPAKKQILKDKYQVEWDSPIDIAEGKFDPCDIPGACEVDSDFWWTIL